MKTHTETHSPQRATCAYISDLFIPERWDMPGHFPTQLGAINNLCVKKGMGVRCCVKGAQSVMNSWGPPTGCQPLEMREPGVLTCCCSSAIWGVGGDVLTRDHCVPREFQPDSSGVAVILIVCGWLPRLEGWHSWAWVTMAAAETLMDGTYMCKWLLYLDKTTIRVNCCVCALSVFVLWLSRFDF